MSSEDTSHSGGNEFFYLRGRVALGAILRALHLQPGDEVLLQAFTCLAVPSPIVGMGLKPVYVDVNESTCNLSPELLEERITPRSRVILVQHTFGIPAPMKPILALAQKHGLVVIEDCCHVLGSRYSGKDLGTFGDAAFYSYEWGKPIIVGVGGRAVIRSEAIRQAIASEYGDYLPPRARDVAVVNLQYAAHRLLRHPALFWSVRAAYRFISRSGLIVSSFREEEFEGKLNREYQTRMAAGLRRRLEVKSKPARIARSIEHRRRLGDRYREFAQERGIRIATPPEGSETVYLRFPLFLVNKAAVIERARASRIEMGDWFLSPVHPLSVDQWDVVAYRKGSCPVAERLSGEIVTLPVTETVGRVASERTMAFVATLADEGLVQMQFGEPMNHDAMLQPDAGVLR